MPVSTGAGSMPSVSRAVSVGGVGAQESGVGELGGVDDVHAHHVDRGVLGRESADQLLALSGRVARQRLDVDPVRAA